MRLAASNLPAAQDVALWTVPPENRAVVTVAICNRSATSAKVRLAITDGAAPVDADWIEFDSNLPGSGVLERTGLALSTGQQVYVRASVVGISASVYGIVEAV